MPIKLMQRFLQLESAGGILLFAAAILAILWANSFLAPWYQRFIDLFLFTINDGLMAIFFLLVGMELKRGFADGAFSNRHQILLPAAAALGGMLVPVMIYVILNAGAPHTLRGWAIPIATDIAFALGVLSLLGKRIPTSLTLFLLALAIFDDIGAIFIIGFFYTVHLAWGWCFGILASFAVLCGLNYFSITRFLPYVIAGASFWFCFLESGIHPTLAGVLLALTLPIAPPARDFYDQIETRLHPWVVYGILPLFALANAGFSWQNLTLANLTEPIVLGIALGLFLGKQIGIGGAAWCVITLSKAVLPDNTSWLALYGVALLGGIGFTMSLFLGTLAFPNEYAYLTNVRLGVIIGSLMSALTGAFVLFFAYRQKGGAIR